MFFPAPEFPVHHSPSPHVTSEKEEHQFQHKAKLKDRLSKSTIVAICLSEESKKNSTKFLLLSGFPTLTSTQAPGQQMEVERDTAFYPATSWTQWQAVEKN